MEEEKFLSGYCRAVDSSRTVTAECVDGRLICADCAYGHCIHQAGCPIAAQLDNLK